MRVTGIETTKKGRYALMVDGEFAFSLHGDTFLLCPWLQKGAEVSPERLETLRQEDELRSARERALDLLSAASRPAAPCGRSCCAGTARRPWRPLCSAWRSWGSSMTWTMAGDMRRTQ